MRQVDIITDEPWQVMILRLDNGQNLNFEIRYSYNQAGWFYNLKYGDVQINGRRVVNSINMLRAFRNVLPFGLACNITDKYEPVFIDDFKNGRATLYTLNEADVASIEALIGSV